MSKITRSEYQRVVEENKRIKNDLRILIMDICSEEAMIIFLKWRKYFEDEKAKHRIFEELRNILLSGNGKNKN